MPENRDGPVVHLSHPSCVCREQQLGICTVDGSLGLSAGEHIQRFLADPATHCVGYGRMIRQSTATSDIGAGEGVDATADISVVGPLSRPNEEGVVRGVLVTGIPEDGKISSPVVAAVAAALESSPEQASVSRHPREHSVSNGSVGDPDPWESNERSIETSTASAACSDLMVSGTHNTLSLHPPTRPAGEVAFFAVISCCFHRYCTTVVTFDFCLSTHVNKTGFTGCCRCSDARFKR